MTDKWDRVLDRIHAIFRATTGLKLVSDLHERPIWPGIYPPLDPTLRRRLQRIREAGALFIHIPKNAGISITTELYGEPIFHPTIRYYMRVAPEIVRSMPTFAVWRDPVERFVSAYRYGRSGGAPFARVARAFRAQYAAFSSFEDALTHVEMIENLNHIDHIFRPQFWYVADRAGRIAIDQLCLLEDLATTVAKLGLPGLSKIAHLNASPVLNNELTTDQTERVRKLYAIDYAIYEALKSKALPHLLGKCEIRPTRADHPTQQFGKNNFAHPYGTPAQPVTL